MNAIGILVVMAFVYATGSSIFGLAAVPEWAEHVAESGGGGAE